MKYNPLIGALSLAAASVGYGHGNYQVEPFPEPRLPGKSEWNAGRQSRYAKNKRTSQRQRRTLMRRIKPHGYKGGIK